ncbi:MAG TPA: epoxyqueuosine reductase QueH [Candidatus Gallimonas intestinavium]|uniref:Epoxyqueuosine reductase QueH n=1 Tax=Candidatus Gallimonas intestinavium TaxID=2838603 RepID=A0A9D2G7D2_9FIRM|nr:epoxyqueuosine reductase QueH [Candidatus Gallimonas intestinavium]
MNAVNYDKLMQEELRGAQNKRLLLHSCCAPCSSHCLSELSPQIGVTVFYYNPNLDCAEEYEKRKREQIRFLRETGPADFLDCDYAPEDYISAVRGLEEEKEGGARCAVCFRLRLERTAREAKARGFDYFATTLTVSPLKNAKLINEIGFAVAEEVGVPYLPSDFKKRGGYLHSVRLSEEYGLYRQDYCGCAFSKAERERQKQK